MQHTISTRRGFLTGHVSTADHGPYPPGATAASLVNCSACGECVDACPTRIISIRGGIPVLDFRQGECTFCGQCAERCPERVFPPEPTTQFQHHAAIGGNCLAMNRVDCQACRDVCQPMAIRFRPQRGGPFRPTLDEAACTGCGACVAVCPASAVSMVANAVEAANV